MVSSAVVIKMVSGANMSRKRRSALFLPVLLIGVGLVLIFGATIVILQSSTGIFTVQAPTPTTSLPFPQIKRISLADAKAAYETKSAVFVDVRGEPYYSQGHIPGAISFTAEELPDRSAELDPGDWIITYCS
jgi:hypothetical protein